MRQSTTIYSGDMHNILHINIGYPPADGLGGPTRTVSSVANEQARRGHRVTVVCTNLHDKNRRVFPHTEHRLVGDVSVHYMRTHTTPLWPGTLGPLWVPDLFPFLRKELGGFDIVHIHGIRDTMSYLTAVKATTLGTPYVVQPHGEVPYLGEAVPKRLYDRLFTRRIVEGASAFLALSRKEASECRAMSANAPVEVVSNGIAAENYFPLPARGWLRARVGISPECRVVLFLGRLNWIKGIDLLLEGFARCREKSCLVLVGPDEGEGHHLHQMARHLGIQERTFFVGPLPPGDVLKAYVDADLFVLTSRKELFPNTVMEACGAGVPIVMTDTCEIAGIVSGKAALVVPPERDAIGGAIDRLLADHALSAALAQGGKELARTTFSMNTVVDRLDEVYAGAMVKKGKNT